MFRKSSASIDCDAKDAVKSIVILLSTFILDAIVEADYGSVCVLSQSKSMVMLLHAQSFSLNALVEDAIVLSARDPTSIVPALG